MGKIHANRLYLGAVDPHLRAHGDTQYWLTSWLALQGGAFTRIILTEEDKDSIRPQVSEIWLGPEIATAKGIRMGLETELGFESAGPENLFANTGDAVSRRLGLRAYSEIPFKLASELSVALRPSFLASWTNTDSALSSTENQARYSGGLIAILNWDQRAKFGARYEAEILPELGSSGTQSVHRSELWIEGTY
jgi:hypothetical protein